MPIKFSFDSSKPVIGEACVDINKTCSEIFHFVGKNFFDNYPKWALEVVEFEPLDGKEVFIGAKAKQIRNDSGAKVVSIFFISDYQPQQKLTLQGVADPYRQNYLLENHQQQSTRLTFRFELLELDIFMRPFEKLIRAAIEEGAENTVENIKNLIIAESN